MLNVYNYFVQDYVARTSHYSAHKQRELRDIYKNIVKSSASEPLFKVELSKEKQTCALQIKENALALRDVTKSLQDSPLLRTAGLISSDESAVSANFLRLTDLNTLPENTDFEITVDSLASGQVTAGALLPSEEAPLAEGSYSFMVSLGYENYSFRFNVAKDAPAFDLQSKLADFINKTGIGLKAQVYYDKERSLSSIELSALQTGTYGKSSFTLSDTQLPEGAKKGVAEVFGLNKVTSPAKNARINVNGTTLEAPENTIVYDDLLRFSLHHTTTAPVHIRPITDRGIAYHALESFTTAFNQLVETGRNTLSENKGSAFLLQNLSHLISANYSMLTAAGVTADENGLLTLSREKVEAGSAEGDSERLFSKDSTFLNALNDRLDTMILNPMKFIDKKLVTYPSNEVRTEKNTSPYTTSIYTGMLFNNYC